VKIRIETDARTTLNPRDAKNQTQSGIFGLRLPRTFRGVGRADY